MLIVSWYASKSFCELPDTQKFPPWTLQVSTSTQYLCTSVFHLSLVLYLSQVAFLHVLWCVISSLLVCLTQLYEVVSLRYPLLGILNLALFSLVLSSSKNILISTQQVWFKQKHDNHSLPIYFTRKQLTHFTVIDKSGDKMLVIHNQV